MEHIYKKKEKKQVIVGHDCRESADYLVRGLETGLVSTGVKIYKIGMATTPMVYYARKLLKNRTSNSSNSKP